MGYTQNMELLTHSVRRVASPDDLQLPGDYTITDHLETGGKICHSVILNCAFCNTPNGLVMPQPNVIQRVFAFLVRGIRPLTIPGVIVCYGNTKHRFAVRKGAIIPAIV